MSPDQILETKKQLMAGALRLAADHHPLEGIAVQLCVAVYEVAYQLAVLHDQPRVAQEATTHGAAKMREDIANLITYWPEGTPTDAATLIAAMRKIPLP